MKINSSKIVILAALASLAVLSATNQAQTAPGDLDPSFGNGGIASDLTVTRGDDRNAVCLPGDCSLREAVNAANASPTDDAIDFAPGLTTVTLTYQIVINNAGALAINGPGANVLTIDGGAGTNRIFLIFYASVTISGVTLTGGNGTGGATPGFGGAMLAVGGSTTIDGVRVTGNTAGTQGGGMAFQLGTGQQGGNHRIINSTISDNHSAGMGGGFCISGTLTIVNSTISGNWAGSDGGGFCTQEGDDITLRNVTITNNTAARFGGGIANYFTTLNFANTIVAGNTATDPRFIEINTGYAPVTSLGGNLIGDSPGDSPPTIVYQPTDIRDTDPQFGPLQNNGGMTPTHALWAASPAIDKGLNALAVDPANGNALAFDQRGNGFPRIRDGNGDGTATVDIGPFEGRAVLVTNLEELYSAVNNPQNAGINIIIAPGIYMLSVNDPGGMARPNGGRLDLQENMSLQGVVGDRNAVVIDAMNLPTSSYNAPPLPGRTAAIRIGRGTNSIEWLTIRNAVNGTANIRTDLVSTATVYVHIAHVVSTGGARGIDIQNTGATMAGRVIKANIIDNDLHTNRVGAFGEGLRLLNIFGADGAVIVATLNGNRSYNNFLGLIVENNQSNLGNISVNSTGDRFFDNGFGALVGGGLSQDATPANGNTVNFTANGTRFENNSGFNNFDHGGLVIIGGENTSIPNGTSNNTVNVELRSCVLAFNQLADLMAIGARSKPVTVGTPGMNNHVNVSLLGVNRKFVVEVFTDSIPDFPGGMNTVTITRWPKY